MVTKAEVDAVRWKRTHYGNDPHEYIIWKWWPELFVKLAHAIETSGVTEVYKGRRCPIFIFEGYKYWRIINVINRKPVEAPSEV